MAYTIPSDTHAVSDTGHTTDHNNIVDVLTGMGSVFNVLNTAYSGGADKTGVADSTAAIQAAINAANAAGGGTVRIPAGIYKISSALTLYAQVNLVGDGANLSGAASATTVSVIKQTSTTANGISAVNLGGNTIRSLTILGPGSGSGTGFYSILQSGGLGCQQNLSFVDVTIDSFGAVGLNLQNVIVSRFERVTSQNNGTHGFYIWGTVSGASGTSCSFVSCYARNNGEIGWWVYNMTYTALHACAADTNGVGYQIDSASAITLTSCGAEGTVAKNGYDGTSFKITNSSTGVTCTGCFTYTSAAVSWWVTGSSQIVTLAGVIENSPGGGAVGIKSDTGTFVTLIGYSISSSLALTTGTYSEITDGTAGQLTIPGTAYTAAIEAYGLISAIDGTDTSGTATASTPTLSTGTAAQISTAQDVMLYANIKTASTFSLAIGATSTPATTVVASGTAAIGLVSVRVPKSWYVKSTFTSADVTWTAVTC